MAGIGLQGAYGAQGGKDALEELVAQRMKETLLKQAEEQRQFQNQLSLGNQDISRGHLSLAGDRFGYEKERDAKSDSDAANEAAQINEVIAGLPAWLQGPARAQGVGLNFDPQEMTEPPETRDGADRRRIKLFRIEESIRNQNRPPQVGQEWVIRDGKPTPIPKGTAQPGDRPYDAVAERQAQGGDTDAGAARASEVKALATELLNDPSLSAAFGPIQGAMWTVRGDTANVEAKLDRLQSLLTLDNLGLMKGVLSDSDIKILTRAATMLSNRRITDAAARQELERISGAGAATVGGSTPPQPGDSRVDDLLKKYGGG